MHAHIRWHIQKRDVEIKEMFVSNIVYFDLKTKAVAFILLSLYIF